MTERATGDLAADGASDEAAIACVDVLIAARDRADTIERAVFSALAQAEVRSVIVVDDGSKDDTAAKAGRCDPQGERVIVERLPSSFGPSAARNRALKLSTAPWVAVLDGDDFFLPGRFGALLPASKEWDLVADDLVQVRDDQIGTAALKPVLLGDHREPFALDLKQFVLGNVRQHGVLRTELGFLKPMMRRSFIDRHSLRYDENLRLGEDYALYARALAAGARFLIIPTPGYASVVRADSLSARHSREDLECLRDSDDRLIADTALTPDERRALKRHHTSVDCRVQWLNVIESVKSRQSARFLAAFCRSPTISLYLTQRLFEELRRRLRKAGTNGLR